MTFRLRSVVNSGWFNRLMVAVILLAGVLAGLETSATLRESYGSLLQGLDALVLVIFVVEIALKIAAHGRRADSIVRNMLLHSRGTAGERRDVLS